MAGDHNRIDVTTVRSIRRGRQTSVLQMALSLLALLLMLAQQVTGDTQAAAPKVLQPQHTLKVYDGLVPVVSYSPDGKLLMTGVLLDRIRMWDAATGQAKGVAENLSTCSEIAWLPTLKAAACLVLPGEHIYLYDASTGQNTPVPDTHSTTALTSDPRTGQLMRGSFDSKAEVGSVHIVDPKTGKASAVLEGPGMPASMTVSADGSLLAAGCFTYNGKVMNSLLVNLWDIKAGKLLTTIKGETTPREREISRDPLPAVMFTPDGSRLLYRAGPRSFSVWDIKAAKKLKAFDAPEAVGPAAFSPDGRLAAGVAPGYEEQQRPAKIYVLDVATGKTTHTLAGGTFEVTTPAFSPDGKSVAAGTTKVALVWSLAGGSSTPADGKVPLPEGAQVGGVAVAAHKPIAVQATEWVRDNNGFGPNHQIVVDMSGLIKKADDAGNDFALRFGPGLMKSGKATLLFGVGGKLLTFELTPAQEAAAKIPEFDVGHWLMSGSPRQLQSMVAIGQPALPAGPISLKKFTRGRIYMRVDKPPLPDEGELALRCRYHNGDSETSLFDYLRHPLAERKDQLVEFAIPGSSQATATGPTAIFIDLCVVTKDRNGGNIVIPLSRPVGTIVHVAENGGDHP